MFPGHNAGSVQRTREHPRDDEDHYQQAKEHASASANKAGEAVDEATTRGARRQALKHQVCWSHKSSNWQLAYPTSKGLHQVTVNCGSLR